VCRFSTMPATDWRTESSFSCVAFRTIMSSSFVFQVVLERAGPSSIFADFGGVSRELNWVFVGGLRQGP
jgi:hypothetical protein